MGRTAPLDPSCGRLLNPAHSCGTNSACKGVGFETRVVLATCKKFAMYLSSSCPQRLGRPAEEAEDLSQEGLDEGQARMISMPKDLLGVIPGTNHAGSASHLKL